MAAQQPVYRVVYENALWLVRDEQGRRVSAPLTTEADAVIRAKELAVEVQNRTGSARIIVEDAKGKVVSDFVYQREERPALERDETGYDSYYATHAVSRASRPSQSDR